MAQVIIALGERQEVVAAAAKKPAVKRKPATAKKVKDPVKALDTEIKALQASIAADTKKLNELIKKKAEHSSKDISAKLKDMKVKTTKLRSTKADARLHATHSISMKHKSNAKNALHSVTLSKVGGGHAIQVFSKVKTISNPGSAKWRRESIGTKLHKTIEVKNTAKGLESAMNKAKKIAESLAKKKMPTIKRMTK